MKITKYIAVLCAIMTLLCGCMDSELLESGNSTENSSTHEAANVFAPIGTSDAPTTESTADKQPPQLPTCKAAAICCVEDNEMIYSVNENVPIAPASLTKLLTASTALNYVDSNEIFTVGSEQQLVNPYSSLCLISYGQRISLNGLLYGLLLSSGNDAAYTIAVSTARSFSGSPDMEDKEAVDFFCAMMNNFAAYLGMNNSSFVNPDGWDDDNQYTTVSDLLILAKYVLTVPELREITGISEKTVFFEDGGTAEWHNSNSLLYPDSKYYCEYAVGMKTGTTENAGSCLIAAFVKDGRTYIAIAAGCAEDEERYEAVLELFNYAVS